MTTYLYPHGWEGEGDRLATLESLWDPASIGALEAVGVAAGWRCLEVGAGSGSIATWLADRVGARGRVTALDIDVSHLTGLERSNLVVREHDVTQDPLPERSFDVIHARLLLKHLPGRDEVLETLAAALVPGGWLVVEDTDWTAAGAEPAAPALTAVLLGLRRLMEQAGGVHDYGRLLPGALRAVGLVDIDAAGTVLVLPCGTPAVDFYRLTLGQVRDRLLAAGAVDEATFAASLAALDDPTRVALAPTLIGARGRKP